MSLLPYDVLLIKFEQKCKNTKINTRQMSYMPNLLNLVTLNNSHLKVYVIYNYIFQAVHHSVDVLDILCVFKYPSNERCRTRVRLPNTVAISSIILQNIIQFFLLQFLHACQSQGPGPGGVVTKVRLVSCQVYRASSGDYIFDCSNLILVARVFTPRTGHFQRLDHKHC